MNLQNEFQTHAWPLWLRGLCVLALASGLAMSWPVSGKDCGLDPCPGTAPTIWPDRSATIDNTMRILGWNLLPETDYQIIMVLPDGSVMSSGFVTADSEGDILGDEYDLKPEEAARLTAGQPHVCEVVPAVTGVYQVRAYRNLWSGNLAEAPIAATTFLHN